MSHVNNISLVTIPSNLAFNLVFDIWQLVHMIQWFVFFFYKGVYISEALVWYNIKQNQEKRFYSAKTSKWY